MRSLGIAYALLFSCAYRPLHTGELFGAHRVLVIPPRESQPVGIAGPLVDDLRRRLAAHGLDLTDDLDSADAVLDGDVISSSTGPLAAVRGTTIRSFYTRVSYEAILRDRSGQTLWQGRFGASDSLIRDTTQSDIESDVLATEGNRRVALTRVALSIAQKVENSLLQANPARPSDRRRAAFTLEPDSPLHGFGSHTPIGNHKAP